MEEGGGVGEGGKGSRSEPTMRGVRAKVRPRISVGMLFTNDLQHRDEHYAANSGIAGQSGSCVVPYKACQSQGTRQQEKGHLQAQRQGSA